MVDLSSIPDDEDNNKEPTFKNMLLTQIGRLRKSTDPLDQQLLNYLMSIIQDKGFLQKSWIAEIEEAEQVHRLVKNGKSVGSAIDIVANRSQYSKSALHDKYEEYKNALIEIDQIFKDLTS